MAGIQIPKIQSTEDQPVNAPRIEAQSVDAVTPEMKTTAALEGVGQQVIKVHDELALQAADTEATNRKNDYLLWRKKKLYGDPETGEIGLINQKGDPTKLYKQFDDEQTKKLDDLAKAPDAADWSPMTQNIVNRRLSRSFEEGQLETLTQYGHQQKLYDDNITDSRISLAAQGMPFASSFIVPGDDKSFGPMQGKIADIRNAVIAQGLRDKTAIPDKNGADAYLDPQTGQPMAVTLSDTAKAEINKQLGKSLSSTLENLVNSSGPDAPDALAKAKAFQEKFGSMIDEYSKGQIKTKMEKAETEQDANDIAHSLRGKSPDQIDKALADVPEATRRKAEQYLSDSARYMENLKRAQREQNDEALTKKLQQYKQDNPNATVSDMESQPWYKNLSTKISLSQDKAAKNFMEPPKTANPKAVRNALNILQGKDPTIGTDLSKMSASQVMQASAQLPDSGIGAVLKRRLIDATVPSNAQKNQQFMHAMKEVKTELANKGLVTLNNDQGTDVRVGTEDADNLGKYQSEFAADLEVKGNLSYDQIKKEARDFVATKMKNQPVEKSWYDTFKGAIQSAPAADKSPQTMTQDAAIGKAKKLFEQTYSRTPNADEVKKYIQEHPGLFK